MTDRPIEPMDAFEVRLSTGLLAASGIAIRAVDPVKVAMQLAAEAGRAPRQRFPRGLVLILATIGLGVALFAAFMVVGRSPTRVDQIVDHPPTAGLIEPSPRIPGFTRLPLAPQPRLGHIAYQSGDDIFVANADGSHATRITNAAADGRFYRSARWAGSVLTFLGDGPDLHETLFALDRIDGEPRAVGRANPGQGFPQAVFSSDGHRFALLRGASLSLVDTDGTTIHVAPPPGFQSWDHSDELTLSWAPDGTTLLASACSIADCTKAGDTAVFRVAADGRILQQLSTFEEPVWGGQVSPDGTRVAFVTCRPEDLDHRICDPDWQIGFMAIDGSDRTMIPPSEGDASGFLLPRWSADSTRVLAAARLRNGSMQVAVVDAAGKGVPELIGPVGSTPFAWTPDGTEILALTGEGGRQRLVMVPTDGSPARDLIAIDDYAYGADLEWIAGSGPDPFDGPAPSASATGS
jgi:hypothetical protein